MEKITAEQATEAAKGLNFEQIWIALQETRELMRESHQETEKQIQETQKQIRETQKQMTESHNKMERIVKELSNNIGGINNTLGDLTEAMFSHELWKKFNDRGFAFTKQGPRVKFKENKQLIAEVDYLLENGEYIMPVEIKTALKNDKDVDKHIDRIIKIRQYMDVRKDMRKIVGAIAGGHVTNKALEYAHENGLYVIVQSGESMAIADEPPGFTAREWGFNELMVEVP